MIFTNANRNWYEDYPKKVFIYLPRRTVTGELVFFHWVWKYIRLWDDYGVDFEYALEKKDIPQEWIKWDGPR